MWKPVDLRVTKITRLREFFADFTPKARAVCQKRPRNGPTSLRCISSGNLYIYIYTLLYSIFNKSSTGQHLEDHLKVRNGSTCALQLRVYARNNGAKGSAELTLATWNEGRLFWAFLVIHDSLTTTWWKPTIDGRDTYICSGVMDLNGMSLRLIGP